MLAPPAEAVMPLILVLLIADITCVNVKFGLLVTVLPELVTVVGPTVLKPTSAFAVSTLTVNVNSTLGVVVVFVIVSLLPLFDAVTFAIPTPLILSTISVKLYVLNSFVLVVDTIVLTVNAVPELATNQSLIASGNALSSKSACALLMFAGVTVSVPSITLIALYVVPNELLTKSTSFVIKACNAA